VGINDFGLKRFSWKGKGLISFTNGGVLAIICNSLLTPLRNFVTYMPMSNEPVTETQTWAVFYSEYIVTYAKVVMKLTNLDTTHVVWAAISPNADDPTITIADVNDDPPYSMRKYAKTVQLSPNGTAGCSKTLTFGMGMAKMLGIPARGIIDNPAYMAALAQPPGDPATLLYWLFSAVREDAAATALNVAVDCTFTAWTRLQRKQPWVIP